MDDVPIPSREVRSPYIARQGYKSLDPVTSDDVLAALPPLPIP